MLAIRHMITGAAVGRQHQGRAKLPGLRPVEGLLSRLA